RLLPRSAWPRPSELLDIGSLGWDEVEQRVGQALVYFWLAEDDLVHVALRVRHHARQHLAVLAHHEQELLHAGHGLERRQLQPFSRGQSLRDRRLRGRELLQQIALAPEKGEGAAELVASEVALDLRFLIVGPPDPEGPVL